MNKLFFTLSLCAVAMLFGCTAPEDSAATEQSVVSTDDERSAQIELLFDKYVLNEWDVMDMYAENVLCKINNVEFSGRDNLMGGFKMHHDALYNEIAIADASIQTEYWSDGSVWSRAWFTWTGNGQTTGESYSNRGHFSYKWQDGVIADFKMTDGMLQGFIRKINLNRLARPRMVICVPSGVTEVERRAVKDSGERANAREVYLIEEPVAAAIGIGLDISQPIGNIIVDIGGGTTEIAVISLNGVVTKETIRIAGDEMDEAVLQWFRNEHKLEIGLGMSEKIKKTVGSAMKMKSADIAVKGRDLVSGIPKTIEVSSDEVRLALKDPVNQIVEAVKRCLEQTPPELAADILERGIILAGGGSLLKGIDQIIRERTNVPVNVSEDPLLSVVKGTGMVLENLKKYEAVLL